MKRNNAADASSLPIEARRWLSRILKHWTPVLALLTFLGGVIGIASLFALHQAIGRPDLFMDAINNKSALIIWLFGVLGITSLYLLVMATTSIIFAIAMTLFNRVPLRQHYVVGAMVLIVGSGYLVFAGLLARYGDSWLLLYAVITSTLTGLAAFRFNSGLKVAVRKAICRQNNKPEARASFEFTLMLFVVMTVVCGAFPFQLLQIGNAINDHSKIYTAFVIFVGMMLPLTPVFVFYRSKRSTFTRYVYASLAIIIQFGLLVAIAPGLLGSITYAAAGRLDIRQYEPHSWLLQDPLAPQLIRKDIWNWTSASTGVIQVEAIQLYTFGDVLLLCPPALAKTPLQKWPTLSAQCVKTKVSTSRVVPDSA
ncbi:hypothetical protein QCD79_00315 [Pseudomonas quasicaspiana]|nr:hypothetical protein [Pseudomonas quasicaspiana]